MAFSIFKKPDKKSPINKTKPTDKAGSSAEPGAGPNVGRAVPAHKPVRPGAQQQDDLDYAPQGRGHIELQLKDSHDPIESDIEEAAILFANNQNTETRNLLESSVHAQRTKKDERLWLMLFDFYQIVGLRKEFDALGLDYARIFEKSLPVWRSEVEEKPEPIVIKPGGMSTISFKGELNESNKTSFDALEQAIEKSDLIRLDLSKIASYEATGCDKLLALLEHAKKLKHQVKLFGRDAAIKKLTLLIKDLPTGEGAEYWLLLLELYQLSGMEAEFEEMALNYAIAFEVSPPWWDPKRVENNPVEAASDEEIADEEPLLLDDMVTAGDADTFPLYDEIKNARYEGLADFAQKHNPIIIDFSGVKRIDFVSAGLLINILTPSKRDNKKIFIKNPNHLVAALLNVVGVQSIADIQLGAK